MGSTLSNVFKGQQPLQTAGSGSSVPLYGTPPSADPSTGTKVARGVIQGALQGLAGGSQPSAPMQSPMMPAPAPAPTPVDPSFFSPTNFGNMPGRNPSAFYGGGGQ